MKEDALVAALVQLSAAIEYPPVPDVRLAPTELAPAPRRRPQLVLRWAVGAGAAAVIALALLVAPLRDAVAGWLGIDAVRIVTTDGFPPDLDEGLRGLGDPVPPADAVELAGGLDLWPDALGTPDHVFVKVVGDTLTEVSMAWLPSDRLPAAGSTGVGALLTRFEGSLDRPVVEKIVGPGTVIQSVRVGASEGFWLAGEAHTFGYVDPDGDVVLETVRLAGNTLIWENGGASYRFESGLDEADAVELVRRLGR